MTQGAARVETPDAEATRELGRRLAGLLRAGDLVVLTGDLGSGKTTLAQGIGAGLGVRGQVASPTFIIARVHPPLADGPTLVHVDAYRLSTLDELEALDLDTSMDESVTVVEWGEGMAEVLSADRLEITVTRPRGGVAGAGLGGEPVGRSGAGPDAASGADADPAGPGAVGPGAADPGAAPDPDSDPAAGTRTVVVRAVGARWAGVDLTVLG